MSFDKSNMQKTYDKTHARKTQNNEIGNNVNHKNHAENKTNDHSGEG